MASSGKAEGPATTRGGVPVRISVTREFEESASMRSRIKSVAASSMDAPEDSADIEAESSSTQTRCVLVVSEQARGPAKASPAASAARISSQKEAEVRKCSRFRPESEVRSSGAHKNSALTACGLKRRLNRWRTTTAGTPSSAKSPMGLVNTGRMIAHRVALTKSASPMSPSTRHAVPKSQGAYAAPRAALSASSLDGSSMRTVTSTPC